MLQHWPPRSAGLNTAPGTPIIGLPSAKPPAPRRGETRTAIFAVAVPAEAVRKRLQGLSGVIRFRTNVVRGTVWVDYDPSLVTEDRIRRACGLKD